MRRLRRVRPRRAAVERLEDAGRRAGQHVVGRVVDDEQAEQRVSVMPGHLGPWSAVNRLENAARGRVVVAAHVHLHAVLADGRPDGRLRRGRERRRRCSSGRCWSWAAPVARRERGDAQNRQHPAAAATAAAVTEAEARRRRAWRRRARRWRGRNSGSSQLLSARGGSHHANGTCKPRSSMDAKDRHRRARGGERRAGAPYCRAREAPLRGRRPHFCVRRERRRLSHQGRGPCSRARRPAGTR